MIQKIIFSKQADHDADLFEAWLSWYQDVWAADRIIVMPFRTRTADVERTCEFYRLHNIEVYPHSIEAWDASEVWKIQLEELEARLGSNPAPFVAVSADADQFLEPRIVESEGVAIWDVRSCALVDGNILTLPDQPRLRIRGGFLGTLHQPRIGICGHVKAVPPSPSISRGWDLNFRSFAQFEAKVRAISSMKTGLPTSTHWADYVMAAKERRLRPLLETLLRKAKHDPEAAILEAHLRGKPGRGVPRSPPWNRPS